MANGVEGDKRVAIFVTVIGTETYSLLRNVVAPATPATKLYEDLVAGLKAHLNPKPIAIAEQFKFHRQNQQEGETISIYLAKLKKLAEHCEFRDYREEALCDRLVCGLLNEAIQKRLLTQKDLTLREAVEIAQGMDTASREAKDMKAQFKVTRLIEYNWRNLFSLWELWTYARKCRFKNQESMFFLMGPVAYGSRILTKAEAEQNYPQVEKEALAIIFGIKKFHQAGLPALAAARLQHWAVTLRYDVEFRPTYTETLQCRWAL